MSKERNELLKKVDLILGQEKELIVLKGKMFSPQMAKTKDHNETYYTFKLKTLRKITNDEYGQSYNTYYLVMPVEVSKNFTEKDISNLKNNEVICLCSANAQVKTLGDKGIVVNNIGLYVHDVMLTRNIDTSAQYGKAINL